MAAPPSSAAKNFSGFMTVEEGAAATLRFAVDDRVLCNMGRGRWAHGTVIALRVASSAETDGNNNIPEGACAAYSVKLDGRTVGLCYVPRDDEAFCKTSESSGGAGFRVPPENMTPIGEEGCVRLRFGLGGRVIAKVNAGPPQAGQIIETYANTKEMPEGYCAAYAIRMLSNNTLVYAWQDTAAYCERDESYRGLAMAPSGYPFTQIPVSEETKVNLRYALGTEIMARVSPPNEVQKWAKGKVVKHLYIQRDFPNGFCAAYQVELVSGMFIYVPCDHPLTIRLESDPMPQQSTDTTLPIPKFKSFETLEWSQRGGRATKRDLINFVQRIAPDQMLKQLNMSRKKVSKVKLKTIKLKNLRQAAKVIFESVNIANRREQTTVSRQGPPPGQWRGVTLFSREAYGSSGRSLRYKKGDNVRANLGESGWAVGVVKWTYFSDESMPTGYCAAYLIELAIGGTTIAPFDRPEMVMKINLMKITDADPSALRFVVGDIVETLDSPKPGWNTGGVVVAVHYTEAGFPPGFCAAYQVKFGGDAADASTIYCRFDSTEFVNKSGKWSKSEYMNVADADPTKLRFEVGDKVRLLGKAVGTGPNAGQKKKTYLLGIVVDRCVETTDGSIPAGKCAAYLVDLKNPANASAPSTQTYVKQDKAPYIDPSMDLLQKWWSTAGKPDAPLKDTATRDYEALHFYNFTPRTSYAGRWTASHHRNVEAMLWGRGMGLLGVTRLSWARGEARQRLHAVQTEATKDPVVSRLISKFATPLAFPTIAEQYNFIRVVCGEAKKEGEAPLKPLGWWLDRGISANFRDVQGIAGVKEEKSPLLTIAAKRGNDAIVTELLINGAEIENGLFDDGSTALQGAVIGNHKHVVETLLYAGANVDAAMTKGTFIGTTALSLAAEVGRKEMVTFLIDNGADVCRARQDGFTPLHGAAMKNHPDVVETLIAAGADVNASAIGMNLATPLYMALGNTKGNSPSALTGEEKYATKEEEQEAVQADNEARTSARAEMEENEGVVAVIKLLLEAGADPNISDSGNNSPLIIAATLNSPSAAKLLIKHGADKDKRGYKLKSPLDIAQARGYADIVALLSG